MSTDTDTHKPRTGYWHLWADTQGVSRQSRCELTQFEQQSMSGAAPQWNDVQARGDATVIFAVLPALDSGNWSKALVNGALFGFFAYATYDLTNLATLKGWSMGLAMLDLAWGAVVTGVSATAGYLVTRALG